MIGHQAPGPHSDLCRVAMRCEQVAVERTNVIGEEGTRAALAAPGGMMRQAGNDDAGGAGHVG